MYCISAVLFVCLFDGVWRHFQQYFSYIIAVSFIGGGNMRTRRKPPNCRRSLTNFITKCCIPRPDRDSNSQHQWWKAPISLVAVNSTTIRSRPRRYLFISYRVVSNTYCILFLFCFIHSAYHMLPVSLYSPYLIAPFGIL